jgi:AbrB family looped-hinge helix DNA binding protein
MSESRTRLGKAGRVVVPAPYRKRLGLRPGDELILLEEEDGLRILTPAQAVRRARSLVRKHVRRGRSIVRELIEERRQETRRG